MANQTLHFDTQAMRKAADDIRAKIKDYKAASDSVDSAVKDIKAYWEDPVNQSFVRRYNSDLKVTSESVMKLMEEYAKFLDASAQAYDKAVANGNAGINN